MVENSAETDELSVLLAEDSELDAEEIERRAEEFEIEPPQEADWEYTDSE